MRTQTTRGPHNGQTHLLSPLIQSRLTLRQESLPAMQHVSLRLAQGNRDSVGGSTVVGRHDNLTTRWISWA